jgi:hypothetical protein
MPFFSSSFGSTFPVRYSKYTLIFSIPHQKYDTLHIIPSVFPPHPTIEELVYLAYFYEEIPRKLLFRNLKTVCLPRLTHTIAILSIKNNDNFQFQLIATYTTLEPNRRNTGDARYFHLACSHRIPILSRR